MKSFYRFSTFGSARSNETQMTRAFIGVPDAYRLAHRAFGAVMKVTPEVVERIVGLRRLGRRVADIAQLCGLSEPTVKKVLRRATTKNPQPKLKKPGRKSIAKIEASAAKIADSHFASGSCGCSLVSPTQFGRALSTTQAMVQFHQWSF